MLICILGGSLVFLLIYVLPKFSALFADLGEAVPLQDRIVEVGGSHAQREVFHDTLLEAALRSGQTELARPLLEGRLAKRPNPGRYWALARA